MKKIQDEVLAVKQILQECCDQCSQNAICIPYFKRLKGAISKNNEIQMMAIIDSIIKENIDNITNKTNETSWLIYELESQFPSETKVIELSKILTITIVENIAKNKNKINFKNIVQAIPKWLTKNDRDLVLGSIIQFLFYLDNYVSIEE